MGGTCSSHEDEKYTKLSVAKPEGRRPFA